MTSFSIRQSRRLLQAVPKRQGGAVILIVAFSLVAMLAFAGLAIDSGRGYGVRAQLSAATDAAAIAAARALANGNTQADRIANAKIAATRYFDLNYPQGARGATVQPPATQVVRESTGTWRITVDGSASIPTSLMRVLGIEKTDVTTMGQTIRVSPDVMMVLDSSGSIGADMPALRSAAKNGFVSRFIPGAGGDRVGLVTFSTGAVIDEPIDRTAGGGFDKARLDTAIDSMAPRQRTATSEGMRKAFEEMQAIPLANRSRLRVMLVFSDGAPNIFGAELEQGATRKSANIQGPFSSNPLRDFYFMDPDAINKVLPDSDFAGFSFAGRSGQKQLPRLARGGIAIDGKPGNRALGTYGTDHCNLNRASRNVVENTARKIRDSGIRIYAVGLGNQLQNIEQGGCGYGSEEKGENILRRLANVQGVDTFDAVHPRGLYCFAKQADELKRCFAEIADDIIRLTL